MKQDLMGVQKAEVVECFSSLFAMYNNTTQYYALLIIYWLFQVYKHHWKSTSKQTFYSTHNFFSSNTHYTTSSDIFSKTLNFLLIWSLVFPISRAMAWKSVPKTFNNYFNLLMSALDQLAITTFLIFFSLYLVFSKVLTSSCNSLIICPICLSEFFRFNDVQSQSYSQQKTWPTQRNSICDWVSVELKRICVCALSCVPFLFVHKFSFLNYDFKII